MKLLIFLSLFINLCISQKQFIVPYKVYDFLPTQPGFNLNYTKYATDKSIKGTGLVKSLLNPITHKPEYCCGNSPFNYISNQNEFDQSFKETPGVTKTVINDFKFYPQFYTGGYVNNEIFVNPYNPIDGKGWNEGIPGNNRYWCIEGHYKFKYEVNSKTSNYFQLYGRGDTSVFIDGKLAFEFSSVNPGGSSSVNHKTLNLQVGNSYTFDFFMCQRFDQNKPYPYISFHSPFIFECNNIPGVNDDVCPPKCIVEKDCNDNNPCTVDACPSPSINIPRNANISNYCTHTPVQCKENPNKCTPNICNINDGKCAQTPVQCEENPNKCTPNTCNINNGKCEASPPKTCPPKSIVGVLGIGVACQPYKCEPSSGNCIVDSSKSPLSQLLCSN
ncbi:hypothetical protein ACTA71_006839 [Dictyostelium dimigraforme]